eukprot:556758_1
MSAVDTSANVENQENEPVKHTPIQPTVTGKLTSTTDKKEEEPTTSDTKEPANTKNEADLLSQGRQLIKDKNYYSASDVLSDALQIIQQKNIANTIASVPYYMAYGEALLRLIQSSNDLFAAPAPPPQEEPQEPEAPQLIDETATNNSKEEQEDEDASAVQPNPVAGDTAEDREIAWETLEYARSIMEEHLTRDDADKSFKGKLAFVHSMLGELLIEDENNEQALQEFEAALDLECQLEDVDYRQKAFDRFMACLAAQFCGKDDAAVKHCNLALTELSQRIIPLLKGFKCEEESKENEYGELVSIARGVLGKMDEAQSKTGNAKELEELVRSMEDLMAKLEEVKEVIVQKAAMPKQEESNANDDDAMDSEDPLARLIKGLTSKFGIDEAQLAEFEAMDKNDQNDENNDQNKNNKTNEDTAGVTTIGFGNGATNAKEEDDEVNELGSFGGKKRSMEDAGIDNEDGLQGSVKKIKLNSGDAVPAETEKTK